MDSPTVFPELKGQRYDCDGCGKCCRELVVHLTEGDRKKIDRQKWGGKLDRPAYIPFDRGFVLNHKPNGECVFLREDTRCRIHAEFGLTEKPLACQLYPFTLDPDGDALRVSVRFDCPSIAKNTGGSLAKHKQDVVRIATAFKAAKLKELATPTTPVELAAGRMMSGGELDDLVGHLDRWVRDADRPIMQRLLGLDNLLDTLGAARLGGIHGARFDELIGMLMGDLPSVVESFDARSVRPPSRKQLKLLRHAVFVHCESTRLEEACAGLLGRLSNRVDQLKRARRLAAGTGDIPPLLRAHGGSEAGPCRAAFEQLEQIRPEARPSWRRRLSDENTGEAPVPQEPANTGETPVPQEPANTGETPVPQEPANTGETPIPQELANTGETPVPQELANTGEAPVPQRLGGIDQASVLLTTGIVASREETCGTGVSPVGSRAGRPCHSLVAAGGRAVPQAPGPQTPAPRTTADDVGLLLTRYLRTRIIGRTAFGPGYHGWPVLDGLRALMLAVAVAGWLTRYVALCEGRMAYGCDDVARAIGIVDRNATRGPELRTRSARLRVQYLAQDQGILRLLCAYSI